MKITKVVCSKGRTGFFFDDQKAIKNGAKADGAAYLGDPVTPGFSKIRIAGEAISVMIVLEDGQVAYGDCAAVQYSGAGGRDPLFLAENFIPFIENEIGKKLVGQEITTFRKMAGEIDSMTDPKTGKLIHTAIRYGVTQAILDAVAKANKKLMAQVVAEEYGTKMMDKEIPIFSQSGDLRYDNADKMILKGSDVLPHALINHAETKLGKNGEILLDYVKWLRDRIMKLRADESYAPMMHIDLYGTMGIVFNNDMGKVADYIKTLAEAAKPFKLAIEGPVDVGNREDQIKALAEVSKKCDENGSNAWIVADEWCNTLEDIKLFADARAGHMIQIKTPDLGGINNVAEAVLYCKEKGVLAYQGGTCNETDRSAQVCVHVAMAVGPCQVLAKPGMGVDEGYMIVYNEMQRILRLTK